MGQSVKTKQDQHPNPTIHNRSEIERAELANLQKPEIKIWFNFGFTYTLILRTLTIFEKKQPHKGMMWMTTKEPYSSIDAKSSGFK